MIVGARQGGLSISETADLLGFSAQQSLEFAENGVKNKKTSSEQQFCGQKRLVNERGQRRRARLVEADRKVTVIQITTHYNSGMQKSISESEMLPGEKNITSQCWLTYQLVFKTLTFGNSMALLLSYQH